MAISAELRAQVDEVRSHLPGVYKELARRHLADFVQQAWHVVEPTTTLKWNWHMDMLCQHIEALFKREIDDAVFTIPPRCMKSLLVSVFAPAWWWIDNPGTQFLTASYDGGLSTRDAVKSRRVIQSPWYQERWGSSFQLSGDQNVKGRYENTKGGHRIATSVGGAATGEGGDILIIDDAHNAKKSDSAVDLKEKRNWYKEVWYNRVNDPVEGRRLTIGQRVAEGDVPGYIIEDEEFPVVHVNLPMEFEVEQACITPLGKDPRTKEGELLWEGHYPEDALKRYRKHLGPYGYAGQYQQRPAPRSGSLFDSLLITIVDELPCAIVSSIRSWDKAGTEQGGDYSAGADVAILEDGRTAIVDMVRGQWSTAKREKHMKQTAVLDGKTKTIIVEVEPGSAGLDSLRMTRRNLRGWTVKKCRPTGDKVVRAGPLSTVCDNGDLVVLNRHWTKEFMAELGIFPGGKHDDQVDSACQGFNELMAGGTTWDELYPADVMANKSDGLGLFFEEDDEEEGVWQTV